MFGPKRQSNICVDEPNLPVFSGSSATSSPVFRTSVDGGRTIPHHINSPTRYGQVVSQQSLTGIAPPSLGSVPGVDIEKPIHSPSDELNDVVGIMNHFYKSSEEHREASKTRIKLYENREQQLARMMSKLAEVSAAQSPPNRNQSVEEEQQQRMRLEAKSRQLAEELVSSVKRSEELEVRLQAATGDVSDKNKEITARTIENTRLQHQVSELCSALEDAKKQLAIGAVSSSPAESGMRDVAVMSGLLEKSHREKATLIEKLHQLEEHRSVSPAINEETSELYHHNEMLQQRIRKLESQLSSFPMSSNSELIKELQTRILTLEFSNQEPDSDDMIEELQCRVQSLEVSNEELLGNNTKISIELQAAKERLAEMVSRDMSPPPQNDNHTDPLVLVNLLEQKRRTDLLVDEVMDWKNRCVQVSRHIIHNVEEERSQKRRILSLKKELKESQSDDHNVDDKVELKKLEIQLREEKIASGEQIAEMLWYKSRVAELEDSLGIAEATCEEARERISSLESARDAWWQECEVILRQMAERRKQTSSTMAELDILRKEVNELREAEKLAFQPQAIKTTKSDKPDKPDTSKHQIDLLSSQLNFARSEKSRFEDMLTTALDDGQKTIEKLERQVRERDQLLKDTGKKKKKRKATKSSLVEQPERRQEMREVSQPSGHRDEPRLSTSSTATRPVSPGDQISSGRDNFPIQQQEEFISYPTTSQSHYEDQPVAQSESIRSRSSSHGRDGQPSPVRSEQLIKEHVRSYSPNQRDLSLAGGRGDYNTSEHSPGSRASSLAKQSPQFVKRDNSPPDQEEYPIHYDPPVHPRQHSVRPEVVRSSSEQRQVSPQRSPSRQTREQSSHPQPEQTYSIRDPSRSVSIITHSTSRLPHSSSPQQRVETSASPGQQSTVRGGSEVERYFGQSTSPPPGIQVTADNNNESEPREVSVNVNRVSYSTTGNKNWVSTSPEQQQQVIQQPRLSSDPPPGPSRESQFRDDRSPSARFEGEAEHFPISQLVTSPATSRPSMLPTNTAVGMEVRRSTESQFIGKKDMLWKGVLESSPRSDDELAGLLDAPTTDRQRSRQITVRSPITAVKINLNLSSENPPPPADELSDDEPEIPHTEKVIAAVEEEVGGMLDKLEQRELTISKREERFAEMQSNLKKSNRNTHTILKKEAALQARERHLQEREKQIRENSLASIRKEKDLVLREETIRQQKAEVLQKKREEAIQEQLSENRTPGDTLRAFLEHNPSLTGNMTASELKQVIKEQLHRSDYVGNTKGDIKPRVSSSPNTLTTPERSVALHDILKQFQQFSRGSRAVSHQKYSDSSDTSNTSSVSSSDSSSESQIDIVPVRVHKKPSSKVTTATKPRKKFTKRR